MTKKDCTISGRVTGVQTCVFFFFNDTATTEIYTLSLHDALPICCKEKWAVKEAGVLPQEELVSIKSVGAAATRNGQYKKWSAAATRNGQYKKRGRSEEHRLNSSHPSRSRMPSSA